MTNGCVNGGTKTTSNDKYFETREGYRKLMYNKIHSKSFKWVTCLKCGLEKRVKEGYRLCNSCKERNQAYYL